MDILCQVLPEALFSRSGSLVRRKRSQKGCSARRAVGLSVGARKPVDQGGLGYCGVITSLEGMVFLEWNRELQGENGRMKESKLYTT